VSEDPRQPERAFLVGVLLPGGRRGEAEAHLDELARLADTAGCVVAGRRLLERARLDPARLVGRGQVESLRGVGRGLGVTLFLFDDDLTPGQVRNLEKELGAAVSDRSDLILDIFARRARTREARAQVELARLEHLLPRLTGRWSHLGRQVGGGPGGTKGEGEKQIELDRRMTRRRIGGLRRDLRRIERGRIVRRRARRGQHLVALVGYTNAGKSTLFNALTRAGVLVEDRLFATLDPTVRRAVLPGGRVVLFADTVGFIRKLPHHLVASFRSTLEEAAEADLLLHLVDLSDPAWEEHASVSEQVLADLGLLDIDRVTLYTKVDAVPEGVLERIRKVDPAGVLVSGQTGEGMDRLVEVLVARLREGEHRTRLRLDASRGDLVSHVYRTLSVASEIRQDGFVDLAVRGPRPVVERVRREIERQGALR
jgi:GTP-binding protein HflX